MIQRLSYKCSEWPSGRGSKAVNGEEISAKSVNESSKSSACAMIRDGIR